MRRLDERDADFLDRNLFLQALVGLDALGQRLDQALGDLPCEPTRPTRDGPERPAPCEDPVVLAVLGAVTLRRRLAAVLDGPLGTGPLAPEGSALAPPSPRSLSGSLLR